MESQLLSIQYRDPFWIAIAFACGLAVRTLGLPPLVGFLAAGFVLNALGAEGGEFLNAMADLGITLLLFTLGLKLKLRSLARPEVWGVATLHMAMVTLLVATVALVLSYTHLPLLADLNLGSALLIGFALSFSSTVFAVKILDELGATNAKHGRVAIGVLVMQDIMAVIFIAASMGKLPSPWALALVGLIPLRWVIYRIFDKTGHGELLILFGIALALIGADLFELVGIKADVGALVFGMLLAGHPKAGELSKALLSLKELFLVGFFLSVGMTSLPGWSEVAIAVLFMVLLPLKVGLYFGLFNVFRLRASTAWRTSLNLANYSEFGLIVGAIAVSSGWLSTPWLAVFAVVMSLSFVVSAPLVNIRDTLYQNWRPWLKRFERTDKLSADEVIDIGSTKVMVAGMGRIGTAAYNALESRYPGQLVGIEIEQEEAEKHNDKGRHILRGDVTNPEFWAQSPELLHGLQWVLLTLPTQKANMDAATRLMEMGFSGNLAAATRFRDEEEPLKALGVKHTFNIYAEAGLGFANELQTLMNK